MDDTEPPCSSIGPQRPDEPYIVHRPVYSLSRFDEQYREAPPVNRSYLSRAGKHVKSCCTVKSVLNTISSYIPFYAILRKNYQRSYLPWDLIAGLTMGVFHIPQGMAYGLLAGLKPVNGLYTSFFPVLVYFFFGTSMHLSVGTFALMSLMIADPVERLSGNFVPPTPSSVPDLSVNYSTPDWPIPTANSSALDPSEQLAMRRLEIAISATLLTGLMQLGMGLFHLGFLTTYLSDALVGGFTTAAAVHVCTAQIVSVLGYDVARYTGVLKIVYTCYDIFRRISLTNPATVTISAICILILVLYKELLAPRLKKKTKIPVPIELVVMVLSLVISYFADFNKRFNVSIVGKIPQGLPSPIIPDVSLMPSLAKDSFAMAIVGFASSASLVKIFCLKFGYHADFNQELNAFGLGNIVGSFFQCHVGCGSLSRSSVVADVGMKSQLSSLVSSLLILIVLLFIGPLFQSVPTCVLSAIIIVALKNMFMQIFQLKGLWNVSVWDFLIWVITFVATVLLDVTLGLMVGFLFSLLTIVFRTQKPKSRILGRIPNTDIYKDLKLYHQAEEIPGIKIFRLDGAIYFANAENFRDSLFRKTHLDPEEMLTIDLNLEPDKDTVGNNNNSITTEDADYCPIFPDFDNPVVVVELADPAASVNSNGTKESKDTRPATLSPNGTTEGGLSPESPSTSRANRRPSPALSAASSTATSVPSVHHVIMDCSTWAYIDSVGVRVLKEIIAVYRTVGITVFLAGCKASVRQMFVRTEMYLNYDKEFVYLTVHDAVLAALSEDSELKQKIMEDVSVYEMDI